jgi:hypothetical protein
VRAEEEMLRVAAGRIVATVKDEQALWNRPVVESVRDTMSETFAQEPELTVASLGARVAGPFPAAALCGSESTHKAPCASFVGLLADLDKRRASSLLIEVRPT